MLWVKALHIIFVTSWFAGLFYLPRIFVNLAMLDASASPQERARLLLMARKLYRFIGPLMLLAIVLGLVLWLYFGIGKGSLWMPIKLAIVLALGAYHGKCGALLKRFEHGDNQRSPLWYRWFNEVPVLGLAAVVILVVVKPF
jgi:protoporphyrinogen IX oxidase